MVTIRTNNFSLKNSSYAFMGERNEGLCDENKNAFLFGHKSTKRTGQPLYPQSDDLQIFG
jgi:hypothetical protein